VGRRNEYQPKGMADGNLGLPCAMTLENARRASNSITNTPLCVMSMKFSICQHLQTSPPRCVITVITVSHCSEK